MPDIHANDWVDLAVFSGHNAAEAYLMQGRLEAEGIESLLIPGNPLPAFGVPNDTIIKVPRSNYQTALQILDSLRD